MRTADYYYEVRGRYILTHTHKLDANIEKKHAYSSGCTKAGFICYETALLVPNCTVAQYPVASGFPACKISSIGRINRLLSPVTIGPFGDRKGRGQEGCLVGVME